MERKISTTLPPCNENNVIDNATNYVVVQGLQTRMPLSRNPPPRRNMCFPIVFAVRFVHPSPIVESSFYNIVRYKSEYEFWSNCDDFSCPEKGVAEVKRMVDLMEVPFPLHDVQLIWKSAVNKSGDSVANWGCMLENLFEFLKNVTDLVHKQEYDENCDEKYPFVKLEITKFVKLPKEKHEALLLRRDEKLGRDDGERQRTERQIAAELAIKKVKFDGEAAESCGICLGDMSVGPEVVRTPCSHYGHERCILPWLKKNGSCPFCRFKITPDYYWLKSYY